MPTEVAFGVILIRITLKRWLKGWKVVNIVGIEYCWKAGIVKEKQRFKCAHCKRVQVEKDTRYKYSERERNSALSLYLEGMGFRQIARVMSKIFGKKYVYQTIIK